MLPPKSVGSSWFLFTRALYLPFPPTPRLRKWRLYLMHGRAADTACLAIQETSRRLLPVTPYLPIFDCLSLSIHLMTSSYPLISLPLSIPYHRGRRVRTQLQADSEGYVVLTMMPFLLSQFHHHRPPKSDRLPSDRLRVRALWR